MKTVMVSGSRNWDLDFVVESALLSECSGPMMLMHGDAVGADTIAHKYALLWKWNWMRYPPDYNQHGRSAPHVRNQQMVNTKPDVALFFIRDMSNGTMTTLEKAVKAHLKVRTFYYEDYI